MQLLQEVATRQLKVGDQVVWLSTRYTVSELWDTMRPSTFGSGTEWQLTLTAEGVDKPMAASGEHRWQVLGEHPGRHA